MQVDPFDQVRHGITGGVIATNEQQRIALRKRCWSISVMASLWAIIGSRSRLGGACLAFIEKPHDTRRCPDYNE